MQKFHMYNEVLRKFFKYLVTESYAFIVHIASSAVASYVQSATI